MSSLWASRNDSYLPYNSSLDVYKKTCFANYDELACVRSTVLCLLSALTGLACLLRICRLQLATIRSPHLLLLFIVCAVHAFSATVEWVWGFTTQGSLVFLYLRSLELIVVTHFYLTLTSRVHHCHHELAPRLMVMSLSVLFVYFTTWMVVGFVNADSVWADCSQGFWIYITAGHLATIQVGANRSHSLLPKVIRDGEFKVLLLTSILLTRKLNGVAAQASFKAAQRRQLWMMLGAFELSALANLTYHLVMYVVVDNDTSCSAIFHHKQSSYTVVKASTDIIVYLLPIWTMLLVFRPSQQPCATRFEEDSDPQLVPPVSVINWRNRYRPLTFNNLIAPGTAPLPPYRRLGNPRLHSKRRLSRVRRALSLPSSLRRQEETPTSPRLATIPEESGSSTTSQSATPPQVASFSGSTTVPTHEAPACSTSVEVVRY